MKQTNFKIIPIVIVLVTAFFIGRTTASGVSQWQSTYAILPQAENWGLGFAESGSEQQPSGNATAEELQQYHTYYLGNNDEKVIYLTFDCGYENGNTKPILKALKKHNAKGTFFVVGHFLESSPDLVKQMLAEGHAVGNHTYHHPLWADTPFGLADYIYPIRFVSSFLINQLYCLNCYCSLK